LSMTRGSNLYANLEGSGGAGAANGYSQLLVTGGTSIQGANLLPDLNFTPSSSDAFFLIHNQDSITENVSFANTFSLDGLTYLNVADTVSREIYTFEVSTTGDFADNDPTSLIGNDLVLFDAVPTGQFVPEPPSALILATGFVAVLIVCAWRQF